MSGSHDTQLDAERRAELVALLEERAALLVPPAEVVDRALARCIRHDLRTQTREEALAAERAAMAAPAMATPTTVAPTSADTPTPSSTASAGSGTSPSAAPVTHPSTNPSTMPGIRATTGEESAKTMPDSLARQPLAVGDLIPPGTIVAGYRIEGLLGKGGMGQVYRAVQLSVQREVAFKVLSPRLASDPGFRERFLREARAAGRLHHFNLIAVHDVGEASGLMFFSMELIEGRTVKELMANGPMTLDAALDIIGQTLSALRYAHERGVIHRDIKPDNLMVAPGGTVKVADLGLSRIDSLSAGDSSHDSGSTQAGSIMGTPHYMAPEQGRDAHGADHRSDLYSVGATLYHMLCGKPPFTGASAVEVVLKAATAPLTFPEPGPPAAVRGFISRLMAKNPAERPASAADALALLERLRGGGSITLDPSKRMRRYIQRKRRFRKLLPLSGLAAAAVAAIVVAIAIGHRGASDALARDLPRIDALAQDAKYAEALALLEADGEQFAKGSRRAEEADALKQDLESRWDAWSEGIARPSLDQFDAALKAKRFDDAWNALKSVPDTQAGPKTRQAIDDRHAAFDRAMEELAAKPATEAPRGEDFRKAAEAWRRVTDTKFAAVLWKTLRAAPSTTIEFRENAVIFSASGTAQMVLPALEQRRRQDVEVRTIDFRLRPGQLAKGERWELTLAKARITLGEDGFKLTQDGKSAETLAPTAPEAVLRLRRGQDAFQVKVGDGPWKQLAGGLDNRVEFSWTLTSGRTLEVVAHPVLEMAMRGAPARTGAPTSAP